MADPVNSGIQRKPIAFGDLRGWIDALRKENELAEIDAEVNWDVELGNIIRMGQGTGHGPAFLFNNIKDYNQPNAVSYTHLTLPTKA